MTKLKVILPAVGALLIVGVGFLLYIDGLWAKRLYWSLMQHWVILTLIISTVVAIALAYKLLRSLRTTIIVLIGTFGLASIVGFMTVKSWNVNNVYAAIPEDSEEQLDFEERVPWEVATESANTAMSGVHADRQHTTYLAGSGTYTTPATSRGVITPGYEVVTEQSFDLDGGQSSTDECHFEDEAHAFAGGWFKYSLEREVAKLDRTVKFSNDDVWAYCDDEKPVVVAPLTQLSGNPLNLHEVPAGVAVYDGETGEVEIRDHVEAGELPGAVVAQSYAEKIESSLSYRNNDGIWSVMLGNTGYTVPGDSDESGDDPNASAPGTHQLGYANGEGSAHVTPIQLVTSGTAVEYVLTTDSAEVTAGEHPNVAMNALPEPRQSNPVLEQAIRAEFSDVNWDSGIRVQEITPAGNGEWVASIGQQTNVVYRVRMDEDGNWSITDLRTGNEEEVDESDIGDDPVDISDLPDVSEMSSEELSEIARIAIDELESRSE